MRVIVGLIERVKELLTSFHTAHPLVGHGWGLLGGCLSAVFWVFLVCEQHLFKNEEELQGVFRSDVTVVRAKTDSRLGNRFSSNPASIEYLSEINPDVTALITAYLPIRFLGPKEEKSGQEVFPVRYTSVFFVTPNFFKFLQGNLTLFDKAVLSGDRTLSSKQNSFIIGKWLCSDLTGEQDICPSKIYIKGRVFQIGGIYEFEELAVTQNKAVFLPMSAISLITDEKKTYISKFALASSDAATLEMLKQKISALQLIKDNTQYRPNFEPVPTLLSSRTQFLFSHHFVPFKYVIYLLAILFLFLTCLTMMRNAISSPWSIILQQRLRQKFYVIAWNEILSLWKVFVGYQVCVLVLLVILFGVLKGRTGVFSTLSLTSFIQPTYFYLSYWIFFTLTIYLALIMACRLVRVRMVKKR